MIVREKKADIVGAKGERRKSGRTIIGMDVATEIETRRGRWSDVNCERRGVMKKAIGSLKI